MEIISSKIKSEKAIIFMVAFLCNIQKNLQKDETEKAFKTAKC